MKVSLIPDLPFFGFAKSRVLRACRHSKLEIVSLGCGKNDVSLPYLSGQSPFWWWLAFVFCHLWNLPFSSFRLVHLNVGSSAVLHKLCFWTQIQIFCGITANLLAQPCHMCMPWNLITGIICLMHCTRFENMSKFWIQNDDTAQFVWSKHQKNEATSLKTCPKWSQTIMVWNVRSWNCESQGNFHLLPWEGFTKSVQQWFGLPIHWRWERPLLYWRAFCAGNAVVAIHFHWHLCLWNWLDCWHAALTKERKLNQWPLRASVAQVHAIGMMDNRQSVSMEPAFISWVTCHSEKLWLCSAAWPRGSMVDNRISN